MVVVCHNTPIVYRQTAQSLMELGWGNRVERAKEAHGFEAIDFFWSTSWPRVDCLRDSGAELARREGHSHILFLDADMVWPSDLLEQLLRHHDVGIVGGLYVTKNPPYNPVALKNPTREAGSQVDRFEFVQDYGKELADVDVLGMGCTLVPTAVFDAIGPRPWFEYRNDDAGWPAITEDVPFCLKAKAAGFRIALDPTIKCGHVATMVMDDKWHRRYQRSVRETEARTTVKDEGGQTWPEFAKK